MNHKEKDKYTVSLFTKTFISTVLNAQFQFTVILNFFKQYIATASR